MQRGESGTATYASTTSQVSTSPTSGTWVLAAQDSFKTSNRSETDSIDIDKRHYDASHAHRTVQAPRLMHILPSRSLTRCVPPPYMRMHIRQTVYVSHSERRDRRALRRGCYARVHDQRNDQACTCISTISVHTPTKGKRTVETEHLSEDKNKNHADEETRLLPSSAYTRVANNADGETGSKTRKTDRETRAELDEASEERHGRLNCVYACISSLPYYEEQRSVRLPEMRTETTRP
jgi:hypothetical protein